MSLQRIGAFHLDRVLRRENGEWLIHAMSHAKDGDVSLLHGLEKRRLGARRRAIDFVGEHDVGEDRSALEGELAQAGR